MILWLWQLLQTLEICIFVHAGATNGGVMKKMVFLKTSQISQETTCVGVSF